MEHPPDRWQLSMRLIQLAAAFPLAVAASGLADSAGPGAKPVRSLLELRNEQVVRQVLSARTLLDISLGIGLTNDAPDYQLLVSLPIRLR